MVTREGEKTLTVQNAQMLKTAMNAEKMMAIRERDEGDVAMGYNQQAHAQAMNEDDFGHEAAESQLAAISTAHYQERADIEVEALNDWERQHLGAEASDSDE